IRHVFDPYFKASRGDVQLFAGVGLGLAIARHLVRRHGGDLTVSSTLGVGSTFMFTLPACEPPESDRETQLMQVS
ncbi:MAG: sensor histidine kinase, partial [Actinobacteria bacterium]|nr:sensor histidine kinase [Actinomycetota bacterium]